MPERDQLTPGELRGMYLKGLLVNIEGINQFIGHDWKVARRGPRR